ncbi:MAG: Glyoxalase family protein, partial [uncultured Gemmatimonadaceae bacterium]
EPHGDPPPHRRLGEHPRERPLLHGRAGDAAGEAQREPGRRLCLPPVLRRRRGHAGHRPHLLRLERAARAARHAEHHPHAAARRGRARAGLVGGAAGRAGRRARADRGAGRPPHAAVRGPRRAAPRLRRRRRPRR